VTSGQHTVVITPLGFGRRGFSLTLRRRVPAMRFQSVPRSMIVQPIEEARCL
jgi:hypothetical protein